MQIGGQCAYSGVVAPGSDTHGAAGNLAALITERFGELGPKQRRAAQFILDNGGAVAFLSANDIAARVGVDAATVVRLSQRLGFRGYPDLQVAIRQTLPHYPTFVEKLEREQAPAKPSSVLSRSFTKDRQNLARAAEELDEAAFEEMVGAVLGADRTVLVGGGVARPVVVYLHSTLRMMGFPAVDSTIGSTTLAQELANSTPQSLVLAVGYYRYLRETVAALEAARDLGVRRAVITDSPVSPLAQFADITLSVPVESASHRISLVASLALANALVAELAVRDRERVSEALRQVDAQYRRSNLAVYD